MAGKRWVRLPCAGAATPAAGLALLTLLALAALLAACGRGSGGSGSATAPASAAPAAAQAVELAATDVARAQTLELTRTLAVSGGLKAVDTAFVKARIAAELKSLAAREGDRVAAGQLLGRLDTTEYDWRLRQAEDQAASARAQLDIAERTLANNQALVDQGFISRNALDTSVSNAAAARAALQAARAAAEIARKAVNDGEVRAPIGGLVAQRLAQPGERVAVDTRLLEIVDLSRIELEAAVSPEDVPALRVGQAAQVTIDGLAAPVPARVERIAPSAAAGTRAVMAYLRLQPHAGLRQGLFGRAAIELERHPALLVPSSAVRFDQARPTVVVVDDGVAVERVVTLGRRGEAVFGAAARPEPAVEIVSGLAPGAIVLRATVGSLRGGTRLKLPAVLPWAPAAAGAASPAAAAAAALAASR